MSEIKRYAIICAYNEDGEPEALKMPDNTGEWVLWKDVQDLIPTKPRAMTSEDIQRGKEHVINMSGSGSRPSVINGPNFVNLNEQSLKERSK